MKKIKSKVKPIINVGLILISLLAGSMLFAQNQPFEVELESLTIDKLGGIQSYAFGQADGKWLIVGGRLDGLHRRQPWASFDLAGHNNQLLVIDPVEEQVWSAPLTSLPAAMQEQLSATNMEFIQEGNYLYVFGGYGYSATLQNHTTYDYLTAIKVADVIQAIISNNDFTEYFRQLKDARFQITGGALKKIENTYYLLGGQKFLGRYNPMGPDHGPGFVQEYTNAIRLFKLSDDGNTIAIEHLPSYTDSINLHRRDYNAEVQRLPNGREGITMFSGVFRYDANLPYLNAVTVDADGYTLDNNFNQYYNHYHCPTLPLYSDAANEMHTVFFGGIAQYYEEDGIRIKDDNVPFVKTIARVTRDAGGAMTEVKLPEEMPALLGAGAEFIPRPDVPHYGNGVLMLDSLSSTPTLVGYIYGGINSPSPNIFFINDGTQSTASSRIYKVFIKKNTATGLTIPPRILQGLNLTVYPNPSKGTFNIELDLPKREDVQLAVYDSTGQEVQVEVLRNLKKGKNFITRSLRNKASGQVYFITVKTPQESRISKVVLER